MITLKDCIPPNPTSSGGIWYAFILLHDGSKMVCAAGVADSGSETATVQMPNSEFLTFNIGCSDLYTNGYSDLGVDITSGSSYRVLHFKIGETSGSGWGWRQLDTMKSCDSCQLQDSYYQNFCSGTSQTTSITTASPTTSRPLSAKPQTSPPTTSKPTTAKPQTASPTTKMPTKSPLSSVSSFVSQARTDIESLISSNPILAPKFIRMGFHDCVGGCDGCIDLGNPDHNGVNIPMQALENIIQKYTVDQNSGLTRADIYALAATAAADVSQSSSARVDYPFSWFGRKNCEDVETVCLDSQNQKSTCDATHGPHRQMPSSGSTTEELLSFFSDNFGFNASQTVALLGAHSLGSAHREFTGFTGSWVSNNLILSNSYYQNLVGGSGGLSDSEATMAAAPDWTNNFINNSDISGMPSRWQWEQNGLIMLDSDIALVRDFSGQIDSTTGQVTCPFSASSSGDVSACPFASVTGQFVAQYKNDELLFLNDFRNVFSAVLVHGYDTSVSCGNSICPLP